MADLANYVKFLRGTPSAYAALTPKDKDTLYFITAVDATVGKLYLGDILVAGNVTADGTNLIDSLGELIDVNLQGLQSGQVLGYNGAEWIPMSLPEAITVSVMTGATATEDGSSGLVPAPKAGDQDKFLRGDGAWVTISDNLAKYKVTNGLFNDTLVNYSENEIRVLYTEESPFTLQNSGENANPNLYYMGFKAYAPEEATHFKEDLSEKINDNTLYDFTGEFAGVDPDGRKYSIVWLPVASYDVNSNSWSYYGSQSTNDRYIGWFYTVEWYKNDIVIETDTIRINLANSDCFNNNKLYYMGEYATKNALQTVETRILNLEETGAEKNIINSVDVNTLNVTEDRKLELKAVPQNIVTGLTKTSWTVQEVEDSDDIFIAQTAVANLEDILKPATFDPITKTGTTGLMTAEQVQKLQALVITDEGIQVSGKVNADNVEGLASWITNNRDIVPGLYPVEAKNLLDNLDDTINNETTGLIVSLSAIEARVLANETAIEDHVDRIEALEYAMTWHELKQNNI